MTTENPYDSLQTVDARPLILERQQLALVSALREKQGQQQEKSSLADMYIAALRVLADHNIPDRFAGSAHYLRELIEKLPEVFDIPIPRASGNMGSRVNELKGKWHKVLKSSNYAKGWKGAIDLPLRKFLKELENFFDWVGEHRLSRKKRAERVIQKTDSLQTPMPRQLEDPQIRTLQAFDDFFQGISHHTRHTSDEEYDSWLTRFEYFLLERLRPRTFDDHAEIDKIISGR